MTRGSTTVAALMAEAGVRFGTSGVRGRVPDLTDRLVYGATMGFLGHLHGQGSVEPGSPVGLGGDLRPSTPRIMDAVARAIADAGHRVCHLGRVPSPALALWGFSRRLATVMVTGSHIPSDRNGLKFTRPDGEISKADEQAILEQPVAADDLFTDEGAFQTVARLGVADSVARSEYLDRLTGFFGPGALSGLRVGVYQHSAVGRDDMVTVLNALGADTITLGWSTEFVPVDTEAIRPEDADAAESWASSHTLDAIVSTDGDSDRPLIADESGRWLRGDVAGILTADLLGVEALAVPVSCNSAVDLCGRFTEVVRTRIGSPYVIDSMEALLRAGHATVAGYEANGGFLLASPVHRAGRSLSPLPTRDALLVHLAILAAASARQVPVSRLVANLPNRFTASDRLGDFPRRRSRAILEWLQNSTAKKQAASLGFGPGSVVGDDRTDGLRLTLDTGDIVHLRPSGNAPEFRCYAEASSPEQAEALVRRTLTTLKTWRNRSPDGTGPP